MIWATVSSQSCFYWLYQASPSLATKNMVNTEMLAFDLLHFLLQGQTCLLVQVSLDFLFQHSSALWWKGHLLLVLVLEGVIGLHRTIQIQLLWQKCLGHRSGFLWCLWFALEMNQDHSVIFETAPKYCISDSFVDYGATSFLLRDSCPQ